MHIHDVVRVGDLHALGKRFDALILQRTQDRLAASDQHDLAAEVLCRLDRAQRDLVRGVVAAMASTRILMLLPPALSFDR